MNIKITLGMAMSAVVPLNKLATMEMPAIQAFFLTKRAVWLSEEHAVFIQVQNSLVKRYGIEDSEHPGNYKIEPTMPGWQFYVEQMNAVLSEEIEFPFDPLPISEWKFNLTPQDIFTLGFIFDGGVEPLSDETRARRTRLQRLAETGSRTLQ